MNLDAFHRLRHGGAARITRNDLELGPERRVHDGRVAIGLEIPNAALAHNDYGFLRVFEGLGGGSMLDH